MTPKRKRSVRVVKRADCPPGFIYIVNPKYLRLEEVGEPIITETFKQTGKTSGVITRTFKGVVKKKYLHGVIKNIGTLPRRRK